MKEVLCFLLLMVVSLNLVFAQATVTAVSPANNALNISPATSIQVTFSEAILPTSFNDMTSFIVRGSTSGLHLGAFGFSGGNTIAEFTPTVPFKSGEMVSVDISSNLQNAGSVPITPFVYFFTVSVNSSPGTFAAKVDYTAGTLPFSLFQSDVDGDGDADIAVANRLSNTVSILKNNGDGTFAAKVDYTTGDGPASVFISDVDNDGDGDLAVGNVNSLTVSILKNNGDGTFAAKTDYPAGDGPTSLFISDLDGDTDGDLAATNYNFNAVSIFKNNGDGTFAAKTDYSTGSLPYTVFITDADEDGDGDIATANYGSNNVSILKNNGDGTFAAKVDYAGGTNPYAVFVSDLDGDTDADLAVANYGSLNVSILKNNGDGTFAAKTDYPTGGTPTSIFTGDLDGDGDGDLATANYGSNTVSVIKNNGDGTFAANVDYATGSLPYAVSLADLNGDGSSDIAAANRSSNNVSILIGNVVPTNPSVTGLADPTSVTAGYSTLLTATVTPGTNPASTGLTVTGDLSNIGGSPTQQFYDDQTNGDVTAGDNIFSFSATVAPATTAGLKNLPLTVNDAQARMGVGSISLTVIDPTTVTSVLPAINALNVSPSTTIQVTFSGAILPSSFNDATSFIVRGMTSGRHLGSFGFSGGNTVATFTPTAPFAPGEIVVVDISSNLQNAASFAIIPFVYSFTVNAAVAPGAFPTRVDYPTSSNPYTVFVSDVDGDGDGDIATANFGTDDVSILKNNGDGTFATKVDYAVGNMPYGVFISDLDGDGDGDLAVTNYNSGGPGSVSILKNNGDGTFATHVDYPAGNYAGAIFVGDIDGDGDGDVAVAGRGLGLVHILKNNGDATFATAVDYTAGGDPFSVFISDLDGDGDGDLAVASFGANNVSIFKNNGDGTFAAKVDYVAGNGVFSIFINDLDGDGDGDLAVSNPGGICCGASFFSILKNNGDGTFAARVDYPFGSGSLFISDLDGDGDGDIAAAGNDNILTIRKNNGDGTFAANVDYQTGNYAANSVFVSDLDGDGDGDAVVANHSSHNVSVFKNGYTLTVNATNGSVTKDPDQTSYNPGDQVELTATPDLGYQFINWSGDGSGSTNPLIVTMDADKNITANFDIITLTVNIVGNGDVVKTPDQLSYEYGSTVQLEAIPALGYLFDGWSDNASGTTNPLDVVMNGDKIITATFSVNPDYQLLYRTATYNDWATAVDGKGKYKAVKRKSDKVHLKFNIGAPANATGFTLKFNMDVNGAVTIGKTKEIQLGDSILNTKTATFSELTIVQGDTFQFDGYGLKGKIAGVKVVWETSPKPTTQTITSFKINTPKLPMPNLHNVGSELFPGGYGQAGAYFMSGLLVGIPQGVKGGNSVIHPKYKDVQKSLVKFSQGIPQFHADSVRCLDTLPLNHKPISKQLKSMPPDKYSNKLFAELLTLKLNVAASITEKFPAGLGELTFFDKSEPTNPFNGQLVSTVVQKADTMISCLPLTSKSPAPTVGDLYGVLQKINGAFAGVIDTISFAPKTKLTGVTQLINVPFLRKTPGVEPTIVFSEDVTELVPEISGLYQNYPNPFNPTTTIGIELVAVSTVSLKIYNLLGQAVAEVIRDETIDEGVHEFEFNADHLPSGVYLYHLTGQSVDDEGAVANLNEMKKMILIR